MEVSKKEVDIRKICFALFVFSLFVLGYNHSFAQSRRSFEAYSTDQPLSIDGRLDEAVWQQVEPVSGFRQFDPEEGAPATQETEVRVVYGNGNLYVGAILRDDDSAGIRERLTRRDHYNRADWFLISIDSNFNQRTAYTFGVNAGGVQYDALQREDNQNDSWDAVWESAVRKTSGGWNVEIRIPYSMLRFPEAESQTWGIYFVRRIPRLGEQSEWPLIPRTDRANLVANYGRMTDIAEIKPRPNLQVRPYSVGRLQAEEHSERPGTVATSRSADVGGNLKVGLGPNTTLDVAVNPDFGQVESDPAVLNLTAFETFFDEKRPFFVEGQQYYNFEVSGGEMFYSRRIGSQNPIIGASKLSGRTSEGLSFGVMGAATGGEFTPSRGYGVARVRRQFNDYSSVGGILTTYEGPAGEKGEPSRSVAGGGDWDLRFDDNRYAVRGYGAFTHQRGAAGPQFPETGYSGEVEVEKQEGLFRPRANAKFAEAEFDPNNVGRLTKDRTNFAEIYGTFDYDLNQGNPFGPFRRSTVGASLTQTYSTADWLSRRQFVILNGNFRTKNFSDISISGRIFNFLDSYDIYETRGLWPRNREYHVNTSVGYSTDDRKEWTANTNASYKIRGSGGQDYSLSVGGQWNASDRLSLSGSVTGEWENGVLEWSSNEAFLSTEEGWKIGEESASPEELAREEYAGFEGASELDPILRDVLPWSGDAYYVPIFGERDTQSLDFTLRGTVAFTPRLSIQIYNQFFVAHGEYENYKILQNKDNFESFSSYPKSDAFRLNNFQSNVVFRWRFDPGSTLYFVWDHSRRGREELKGLSSEEPYFDHGLRISDQIRKTMDIFPQNNFIVKIEYNISYDDVI